MRTKVLICAAALAASMAYTMAQNVYSLNVVGYYNVTVPANGLYMVANQLNTTNNTLAGLIPVAEGGAQYFNYSGGYSSATFDDLSGAWDNNFAMAPGSAGMLKNPNVSTPWVVTFVGEVLQGSLANTVPVGNSMRASMVPQAGKLAADLGLNIGEGGDQMFVYNSGYTSSTFDDLSGDWDNAGGGGLSVAVGQGFFFKKATGGTKTSWVRNFTVQ